jgi:hypothetical protein
LAEIERLMDAVAGTPSGDRPAVIELFQRVHS